MMYAVYLIKLGVSNEKHLIYAPNSGEDGYYITEGQLEKGINIAGSLSLTIPPMNPVWRFPAVNLDGSAGEVLIPMQSLDQGDLITVDVIEDGISKEIWRGCVKTQNWDIYKNMTVHCEGTLAFFNDILLPEYNFYWSGVIAHKYDPTEGLGSAILDKLKDFIPGMNDDLFEDVVNNIIPSQTFTPDIDQIADDISKSLTDTDPDTEDNVDRRISVYDFLVWILVIYNAQLTSSEVDKRKQIKIGYIDPVFKEEEYKINQKTTQYTIAWDAISSAILDVFGGVMYTSNWYQNEKGEMVYDEINSYLYYYHDSIGKSSQVIQFGENLLNYECELDNTERVSRWYIFGKTKDENGKETIIDMSSVNDGKKYVAVATDGFIGTISRAEYTDLTTPKELLEYGYEKLRKSLLGTYTTTVEAVDLHLIDPSKEPFEPGKMVQVIMSNELYTSNNEMMLESMSIDLLRPENSSYLFKKTIAAP